MSDNKEGNLFKEIAGGIFGLSTIGLLIYLFIPKKEWWCADLILSPKDGGGSTFWYGQVERKRSTLFRIALSNGDTLNNFAEGTIKGKTGTYITNQGDTIRFYLIWDGECRSGKEMDDYMENPPDPPESPE